MGVFGDAYDAVAGAADKATLNVDESVGRQFDNTPGGGLADQAQDFAIVTDRRSQDDFVFTGLPRKVGDTLWAYDNAEGWQTDTVDSPGAALWGTDTSFVEDPAAAVSRTVGDTLTFATGNWNWDQNNNQPQGASKAGKWIWWALVAGVVLWLVRPLLELSSTAAEVAS